MPETATQTDAPDILRAIKTLRGMLRDAEAERNSAEAEIRNIQAQIKGVQQKCSHPETYSDYEEDGAEMKLRNFCRICDAQV